MVRSYFRFNVMLLAVVLSATLLLSCTSKSARFYTLNPVASAPPTGPAESRSSTIKHSSIGILSVEIPDYLDRPQIVTRNTGNGIEIAEFDRWAGELQKDAVRVLAEAVSALLPEENVFVLTGRRAIPADYTITVHIARFDAMPDRVVWMQALWTVLGKSGREMAIRGESNLMEPIQGAGYGAIVSAMSRALDKLGGDIAETMKPVLARTGSPTVPKRQAGDAGLAP